MKCKYAIAILLMVFIGMTGCSKMSSSGEHPVETEAPSVYDVQEETLSVLDVGNYVTTDYPQYNTFVLIDNTIHAMNCLDVSNRELCELAREISDITNSSYEIMSIQNVEYDETFFVRRDYIFIESSDDVRNSATQETIETQQQAPDYLSGYYDDYQVVVKDVEPGAISSHGENTVIVTELMGYVNSDTYVGFMHVSSKDNKQVFIFPNDAFENSYNKENLNIRPWETTNPFESSPYARIYINDAIISFVEAQFYLPGYKEQFSDVLTTEEMAQFQDDRISVMNYKKLVYWKATAGSTNGITQQEYDSRMEFVRFTFEHAINELFADPQGIQCTITYDPSIVVSLSDEPYFSLFIKEMEEIFKGTEEWTAQILSDAIVGESSGEVDEADAVEEEETAVQTFIQSVLYGTSDYDSEENFYNVFMDYEMFYGPQTEEQMRDVLDHYKDLLREYVYVDFGKSYDHVVLEEAIQAAHTEMEGWWSEYVEKDGG